MGPIVVLEVPGIPWRRNTASLQGRTVRGEGGLSMSMERVVAKVVVDIVWVSVVHTRT